MISILNISFQAGRPKNVEFILQKLKTKENSLSSADDGNLKIKNKFGVGGVNRPQKVSWCPIHFVVAWPSKGKAIGINHIKYNQVTLEAF